MRLRGNRSGRAHASLVPLYRAALPWLAVVCSTAAFAAEPRVASGTLVASAVGAGVSVPTLGLTGLFQAVLGLAAVLALVGACAWVARRFGLQAPRLGSAVKLVGGVMLTTKERVVVVEVQGTWLVLGVAPGQVSMLHALPAELDELERHDHSEAGVSFAERLRESVASRFGTKTGPSSGSPSDRRKR